MPTLRLIKAIASGGYAAWGIPYMVPGQSVEVSDEEAARLLSDFPGFWESAGAPDVAQEAAEWLDPAPTPADQLKALSVDEGALEAVTKPDLIELIRAAGVSVDGRRARGHKSTLLRYALEALDDA